VLRAESAVPDLHPSSVSGPVATVPDPEPTLSLSKPALPSREPTVSFPQPAVPDAEPAVPDLPGALRIRLRYL
jgi:hypothetical protein